MRNVAMAEKTAPAVRGWPSRIMVEKVATATASGESQRRKMLTAQMYMKRASHLPKEQGTPEDCQARIE